MLSLYYPRARRNWACRSLPRSDAWSLADSNRQFNHPRGSTEWAESDSDEFENNFNTMMGPAKIEATAKKFIEFEKEHGATYKFGMFAKALLPRAADWADQYGSTKGFTNSEKHFGKIPAELSSQISSAIFANLRSTDPIPVMLKVGTNVDASYDVRIKNFAHEGIEYLGVLMLCPNPALKSNVKSEQVEKVPA